MSTDFVTAQCNVAVHFDGGEYVNFGGEIASFKPTMEANLAEEVVADRTFPHYTLTGMTGGIQITGLRTDGAADEFYDELHVEAHRDAFFSVIHKAASMLGPCGYVKLRSGDIMDSDGVFKLDGAGAAMPGEGFEVWRYGTILPRTLNAWRNADGTNGYPLPSANQLAVINVIDPASMTQLQVEYRKDGTTYSLAAAEEANRVVAGITRGYLMSGQNRVPTAALTGGTNRQWQIRTAGSTGAVFYVGIIHQF